MLEISSTDDHGIDLTQGLESGRDGDELAAAAADSDLAEMDAVIGAEDSTVREGGGPERGGSAGEKSPAAHPVGNRA